MSVHAFNNHIGLEALSRAIFNLDTMSPQYWSMLFTVSKAFFYKARKMELLDDEFDVELVSMIKQFLLLFRKEDRGNMYVPGLYEIESLLSSMIDEDNVIIIRDRSYSKGVKTREISKFEILGHLNEIRSWIFEKVQEVPINYSTPNLNVEI